MGVNVENACATVYPLTANGDVQPRWKIPVQQLTGYAPSGIALDLVHKVIIFSAAAQRVRTAKGIMNAVMTFSWPETFSGGAGRTPAVNIDLSGSDRPMKRPVRTDPRNPRNSDEHPA